MKIFLLLIALFAFILTLVIALGVGVGYVIRHLMPAVEVGTSILIGIVAAGFSIHFFARFLRFGEFLRPFVNDDDEDDDLPPVRIRQIVPARSTAKRKRK